MDLRALMQKLETIDKKQIVKESVETKKVITESVAAPVRQSTVPVFKSSIARGIVEQFGYEVEESTLTENPHASDPSKSAAWAALSPEDKKWLGGADPTDKFILARAPNKGKPAATAPGGAATKPADAPAADAPAADAGATDMSLGQAGDANAAAGAATKPADAPADVGGSINPATLAQYKALLDKLKASQGGATTTPAAPAAPTAPKKPTQIAPAPKPPTPGGATKPADLSMIDKFRTSVGIPAGGTSPTGTKESVSFEDDKTLLAIKNIRY
jgi:hypothetical protein